MNSFRYGIGDRVRLLETDEEGEITGRAEYAAMENHYYIRYRAADGCQRESWWGESGILGVVE